MHRSNGSREHADKKGPRRATKKRFPSARQISSAHFLGAQQWKKRLSEMTHAPSWQPKTDKGVVHESANLLPQLPLLLFPIRRSLARAAGGLPASPFRVGARFNLGSAGAKGGRRGLGSRKAEPRRSAPARRNTLRNKSVKGGGACGHHPHWKPCSSISTQTHPNNRSPFKSHSQRAIAQRGWYPHASGAC